MKLPVVTPERWYIAFWACVWIVTMVTLYVVVRKAVAHGNADWIRSEESRRVAEEPKGVTGES